MSCFCPGLDELMGFLPLSIQVGYIHQVPCVYAWFSEDSLCVPLAKLLGLIMVLLLQKRIYLDTRQISWWWALSDSSVFPETSFHISNHAPD